jgi:electron transfer flavoprotein alpha subunit
MKILVFAEQRNGSFKKSAFEAVSTAKKLASDTNSEFVSVIIGNSIENNANELAKYGAERVIIIDNPKLEKYSTTAYAKALSEIIKKENIDTVILAATAMGKDLAPRLAAKTNGAVAADCTALKIENNEITATRPVYAGKALLDLNLKSNVKIFSLRPNVFPAIISESIIKPEKVEITFEEKDFISIVKEIITSAGKKDVTEADIIITGGRGMKGPEHFNLIEELAGLLNGAVGASRAVVDAGWRPHSEQVGQTGKTVSPVLYIACGISGAIQHLAGMSSSKYIIAINKDKDAPIFQYADYGIIGDVFEVLPAFINELKSFLNK